ncbi:hypothetical protein E2C01_016847 [Portunus trituberculatus]|uniref:Uncharacterized protein n=1 Tax=Portunus trituberculatus TaxID=210409 RepID=A0A5B7DRV5_PORTR|nr:hypothetical protein [Portunus trituberculatus]
MWLGTGGAGEEQVAWVYTRPLGSSRTLVMVDEDKDDGEKPQAHHEGEDDGNDRTVHNIEQRLEFPRVA